VKGNTLTKKRFGGVILTPSLSFRARSPVIPSEARNLDLRLRVNFARNRALSAQGKLCEESR
jgi:hypothetical protein